MKIVRKKKKIKSTDAAIGEFEQKKRILMKKKRKERRKRRFVIFVFLFVCVGIIVAVLKAPFFNVRTVYCVGQQNMTEAQILEIAQVKTDVNIFSTNLKAIKKRLAANPEIAESNVRRLFPNKIKIWVKEAKPVAYIEKDKKYLLIDEWGKIIKVLEGEAAKEQPDVAKVEGIEAVAAEPGKQFSAPEDARADILFKCIEVLSKTEMLEKLNYISVADLSDIQIDYENRLYMMLGSYENIEYKLKFVKKVIDENISGYEKALLDYRGDRLYVGRRETTEDKAEKEALESANKEESGTEEKIPEEQVSESIQDTEEIAE